MASSAKCWKPRRHRTATPPSAPSQEAPGGAGRRRDLGRAVRTVSAWHRGNDLPLLWPIHAKHRVLLFRLLDLMDIRSATQDRTPASPCPGTGQPAARRSRTAPTSTPETICSAPATSATVAMAASPTTTSPTATSPCSPASSRAASGSRPHPGRAAEEPVRHPARYAPCRHTGPKRTVFGRAGSRHQADAAHARPRRRAFYRPAKAIRYEHIDTLFGGEIDWG